MALEKATITNNETGERIYVMFNPEKYSLSKSNKFAEVNIPGLESPILQFVSGATQTLKLDLFYDTYEQGIDVRRYTEQIMNLQKINSLTKAPPILTFSWGTVNFTCVIDSITQNFEMFLSSGIPVRAKLDVGFKEYKKGSSMMGGLFGAASGFTSSIVASAATSIAGLASDYLGDARNWRAIADVNNIPNPRKLATGMTLRIPSLF